MAGREKGENVAVWSSVAVMGIVIVVMRNNPMFALYGMCAQGLTEMIAKYIQVCLIFKRTPVSVIRYLVLWTIPALLIAAIKLFNLPNSFIIMLVFAFISFASTALLLLSDSKNRSNIREFISQKRKKI